MKKIILLSALALILGVSATEAQRVSVRLDFPVGVRVGAPGPRPYNGAVWVGPEWKWRNGRYQSAPGYWARPHRHQARWSQGYWKQSRHGYRWVPGRWR